MGSEGNEPWFLAYGLVMLFVVLWLVRRRSLREEDSPSWIGAAVVLILLGVADNILPVPWAPAGRRVLEVALVPILIVIGLQHTVRMSRFSLQVKNLAQELALLKHDMGTKVSKPREDDD